MASSEPAARVSAEAEAVVPADLRLVASAEDSQRVDAVGVVPVDLPLVASAEAVSQRVDAADAPVVVSQPEVVVYLEQVHADDCLVVVVDDNLAVHV